MCPIAETASAGTDARTLVITRVFDAPPALVFRVWTEQPLAWMGPASHPAIKFEQDFRPGGAWRGCLQSPDGRQTLWQGGTYREIEPPNRLVYSFAWDRDDGQPGEETLITVRFVADGAKTRMIFTQTPFATEDRREGHRAGWDSTFDRLAGRVAEAAR